MIRELFCEDWTVETSQLMEMAPSQDKKTVSLPHDILIELPRIPCPEDASAPVQKSAALRGCWPAGAYKYEKAFFVPLEWKEKSIYIEFEGAYRDAHVLINNDYVLHNANGYTSFVAEADSFLRYGKTNTISVILHTGEDTRWYTGMGIYRPVHIMIGELVHITPAGVKLHTVGLDACGAVVEAGYTICNRDHLRKTVCAKTVIRDCNGSLVAEDSIPVTVTAGKEQKVTQRFAIANPGLWDEDHPVLYTAETILSEQETEIDRCQESFGIRTMLLDAKNGLRINGKNVKLRGGAVHADHGPLGTATYAVSELRRVRKMKEAGFNAIRMAHHPASRVLMEACDREGVYLMDEYSDMWGRGKTNDDYANAFEANWERDVEAMVSNAYNHPSVIMYSIGNEIGDAGTYAGAAWGRKLANKVRELDPHRFTINSINGLVGLAAMTDDIPTQEQQEATQQSGDINNAMVDMVLMMDMLMKSESVGKSTQESYAAVDIAGYNYMESRYEMDGELYPNRVICGSETYPPKISYCFSRVKKLPYLIGDFTWTGWDYLGENGIGCTGYGRSLIYVGYPYRLSYAGDFDILGNRRPLSYYREIVYGLRKEPYIAVLHPQHYGQTPLTSPWSWSDSISCWSWPGYEGKPISVEVYAGADEVALYNNGVEIGRQPIGETVDYKVVFDTIYQPGELLAVAYTNGEATGRFILHSAAEDKRLYIEPEIREIEYTPDSLIYFDISLTDGDGNLACENIKVTLELEGPGVLKGYGSAAPDSIEEFFETTCTMYDGRLLAIVQPTGLGEVSIKLSSIIGTYKSVPVKVIRREREWRQKN